MVQLVEITGVLNEKGCIEIPIVLLAQTGIRTGEEVNLIYLAAGEKDYRNESRQKQKNMQRLLPRPSYPPGEPTVPATDKTHSFMMPQKVY